MPGRLDLPQLAELIRRGEIDTVLTVFPDGYGRLLGKRTVGRYFLDHVAGEGAHACIYLFTVDMEMEPLPGFTLTSWERGYGDMKLRPDLATLRRIPWLPGTALVFCDVYTEAGAPIEEAPRWILRRQVERAAKLGYTVKTAAELELVETSKGEWGRGQEEINLHYAEALEMADRTALYKHGCKEIAHGQGASLTFMAKYDMGAAGSSCHLHSSVWDRSGKRALFRASSPLFGHWLAGQLALARELAYFYAPGVNSYKRYQAGSFAPTRLVAGRDNRTCGFRICGEGSGLRVENRLPGADANPYLAFAATIAAGLHGVAARLKAPKLYEGNAYADASLPQVPKTLREAIGELERSKAARAAFGGRVIEHYLHAARLEQQAFDQAVTDWELLRYFERI
ncbi:MAG: glutamine synthetase [Candidatus Rokubacteria bacterium]|nr:glutamine synthetase [Candidatus Rokubacteria bacterium]